MPTLRPLSHFFPLAFYISGFKTFMIPIVLGFNFFLTLLRFICDSSRSSSFSRYPIASLYIQSSSSVLPILYRYFLNYPCPYSISSFSLLWRWYSFFISSTSTFSFFQMLVSLWTCFRLLPIQLHQKLYGIPILSSEQLCDTLYPFTSAILPQWVCS